MRIYRLFLISISALFLYSCSESISMNIDSIDYFSQHDTSIVKDFTTICQQFPKRLSGSKNNALAQEYVFKTMNDAKFNTYKMEVDVPNWFAGVSKVVVLPKKGFFNKVFGNEIPQIELSSVNLGLSEGTSGKDLVANVVEISRRSQLDSVNLKGKIAFLNEPMISRADYGIRGWQRKDGASLVAEKGAVAVIVRSLTNAIDNNPHTGVVRYKGNTAKIPAIAISTKAADTLSQLLDKNSNIELLINSTAYCRAKAKGNNIIAEIKGSVNPDNIILVTGHLDSWHNSQGAHDDASGVVMAMNVLRTFKMTGIVPNNTIRIMPYQDEETGLSGIYKYASEVKNTSQKLLFHVELDGGVGVPKGFSMVADSARINSLNSFMREYVNFAKDQDPLIWRGNVDNYWPTSFELGAVFGYLRPENPNYFVYHHSSIDNLDVVDIKQLRDCSAAVTKIVYLVDRFYK